MINSNRKKYKRLIFSVLGFLAIFICTTNFAKADEMSWYQNNAEILENNSFGSWGLRSISWGITKVLVKFANASENIFDKAFGFIDVTNSKTVNSFVLHFKPILVGLMALSLFYLGLLLIKKPEKKPELGINIAIFVLCICCSTFVFGELNGLSKAFKSGVEKFGSKNEKTVETYEVIDNNMMDLIAIDNKCKGLDNFNYKTDRKKVMGSGIKNKKQFNLINYTEVLNPSSDIYKYKGKTKDLISKKLVITDPIKQEYMTRDVYNGFGWNSSDDADMANEFYYRYTFSSINAWMQLAALIIIFLTMSYKCVRIAFELVVGRLLAYLYSTELSGGEKIRKILVFIRDSYILLGVTVICIKLYSILSAYVSSHFTGLTQGIFSLFIAFCIIDGPNLVEKLLGMDAGLKSSVMRGMALFRGGVAVGRTSAAAIGKGVKGIRKGVNKGLQAMDKKFNMENQGDEIKKAEKGLNEGSKDNFSGKGMNNPDFMESGKNKSSDSKDTLDKSLGDNKEDIASGIRNTDFMESKADNELHENNVTTNADFMEKSIEGNLNQSSGKENNFYKKGNNNSSDFMNTYENSNKVSSQLDRSIKESKNTEFDSKFIDKNNNGGGNRNG